MEYMNPFGENSVEKTELVWITQFRSTSSKISFFLENIGFNLELFVPKLCFMRVVRVGCSVV